MARLTLHVFGLPLPGRIGSDAGWIWLGLLFATYTLLLMLTVWVITAITRLTYRLAAADGQISPLLRGQVYVVMVVALLCHIGAAWVKIESDHELGVALLILPLLLAIAHSVSDANLVGPAKLLAWSPSFLYLIGDAAVIMALRLQS